MHSSTEKPMTSGRMTPSGTCFLGLWWLGVVVVDGVLVGVGDSLLVDVVVAVLVGVLVADEVVLGEAPDENDGVGVLLGEAPCVMLGVCDAVCVWLAVGNAVGDDVGVALLLCVDDGDEPGDLVREFEIVGVCVGVPLALQVEPSGVKPHAPPEPQRNVSLLYAGAVCNPLEKHHLHTALLVAC